MIDCNDIGLINELNSVSNKLLEYNDVQALIKKQLDLSAKLIYSRIFTDTIIEWTRRKPEEAAPFYFANKRGENKIISYGKLILGGVYLDFTGHFLKILNDTSKIKQLKYSIYNVSTGEKRHVYLEEMLECLNTYIYKDKDISIRINSQEKKLNYTIARTIKLKNHDESIYYGTLEIDKLVADRIVDIIDSQFIIKDISITSSTTTPSHSDFVGSNVISLFSDSRQVL